MLKRISNYQKVLLKKKIFNIILYNCLYGKRNFELNFLNKDMINKCNELISVFSKHTPNEVSAK